MREDKRRLHGVQCDPGTRDALIVAERELLFLKNILAISTVWRISSVHVGTAKAGISKSVANCLKAKSGFSELANLEFTYVSIAMIAVSKAGFKRYPFGSCNEVPARNMCRMASGRQDHHRGIQQETPHLKVPLWESKTDIPIRV
jgi:hypothetical protein